MFEDNTDHGNSDALRMNRTRQSEDMRDLSKLEFRFLTKPTTEMRDAVRTLLGKVERMVESAEECVEKCGICPSCDEELAEAWLMLLVALQALDRWISAERARVLPEAYATGTAVPLSVAFEWKNAWHTVEGGHAPARVMADARNRAQRLERAITKSCKTGRTGDQTNPSIPERFQARAFDRDLVSG